MGFACETCCSNTDNQTDLIDGQPIPGQNNGKYKRETYSSGVFRDEVSFGKQSGDSKQGKIISQEVKGESYNNKQIRVIIKLQSLVRGFLERKRFKQLGDFMNQNASLYFKKEELMETVGKTFFKEDRNLKSVVYTYKCSGAQYNGTMLGGFRHGEGRMEWGDGAKYSGGWEYGFAQGYGTFYHADGDVYEGDWINSKCNGNGIYINKKGARYEGQWKNDTQWGRGVETWTEGSRYEGAYVLGKKQGYGTYLWADQSAYKGEWVDNKIHGIGQYIWADGRKYWGYWSENDMHGIGIYIYSDGVRYEGQFQDDKKTGFGFYYWKDGRKYEGYWYKGKQHGLGIFRDARKGKVKYGLWEHGNRLVWFNEEQINQINRGALDYSAEFKEKDSNSLIPEYANFEPPQNFMEDMQQIKELYSEELENHVGAFQNE